MTNPTTEQIVSLLKSSPLFDAFDNNALLDDLSMIAGHATLEEYAVGNVVFDATLVDKPISLILILEGCVGVVERHSEKEADDVFVALVMPRQCLGEFQLLGDPFPDGIKLVSFELAKTIEIDAGFVLELSDVAKARFFENVARSMVEKINAGNLTLYLRNISDVPKKLAVYLRELRNNPTWKVIAPLREKKFDVNIYWTVNRLAQYLSCKPVSLKHALVDMLKEGTARLQWFDKSLVSIKVDADSVSKLNQKGSPLNYRTQFKVVDVDPNRLRLLEGAHEKM